MYTLLKSYVRIIILGGCFILTSLSLAGQGCNLVRDVVPGSTGINPNNIFVAGNRMFFSDPSDIYGYHSLYVSDGTSEGTHPVIEDYLFEEMTSAGEYFFFVREGYHNDPSTGLYVTDGTTTRQLLQGTEVEVRATGWSTLCNNVLYFTGDLPVESSWYKLKQIWKVDLNGRIEDFSAIQVTHFANPGDAISTPKLLTAFNNRVYFIFDDNGGQFDLPNPGGKGAELWRLDDTDELGATRVLDIYPGRTGSLQETEEIIVHNGNLWFTGCRIIETKVADCLFSFDGTNLRSFDDVPPAYSPRAFIGNNIYGIGYQYSLHRTNLETGRTLLLVDHGVSELISYNDCLYYSDDGCFWVVDNKRPDLVQKFRDDILWGANRLTYAVYNGQLYFYGKLMDHYFGSELLVTDGTNVSYVTDCDINYLPYGDSEISWMNVVNGSLFFVATDDLYGTELRKYHNTLGNNLLNKHETFSVYPNPSHGSVTLRLPQTSYNDCRVEFTDMYGKVVLSLNELTGNQQIDLSALKKGIYLIRIYEDNRITGFTKLALF